MAAGFGGIVTVWHPGVTRSLFGDCGVKLVEIADDNGVRSERISPCHLEAFVFLTGLRGTGAEETKRQEGIPVLLPR